MCHDTLGRVLLGYNPIDYILWQICREVKDGILEKQGRYTQGSGSRVHKELTVLVYHRVMRAVPLDSESISP